MSCLRLLVFLACSAGPATGLVAAAPALRTMIDGQSAELAGICDPPGLMAGPDRRPVRDNAAWSLSLDLREDATLVGMPRTYAIVRASERHLALDPDKPFRATIEFKYVAPESEDGADWATNLPNGGAAVVAWIVDGRPVHVATRALPSSKAQKSVRFDALFSLTAEEAATGRPVLLLWADGDWVSAVPRFPNATDNLALTAILLDDANALEAALTAGARADGLSRSKVPLAFHAAEAGAAHCLRVIARRQPRALALADSRGWTPAHVAAAHGRISALDVLIAAKAPFTSGQQAADTSLFLAVERGHTPVVTALLKAGVGTGSTTHPDLLATCIRKGFADIADQLLAAKVRYDFKSEDAGRQLLDQAVAGNTAMVRWLVDHGVDVNHDFHGTAALALAAKDGDADSARALVGAGAEVHRASKTGHTALMAAAESANTPYARVLLEAGAEVHPANEGGQTALHFASRADAVEIVGLLLEHGADIHARTRTDLKALDFALLSGSAGAARVLATHGATITLGAPHAERMIEAALRNDISEPLEAALREGWPAGSTIAGIWPAARVAQIFGSQRCLAALLAAGAPPPDPDKPARVVPASALDQPLQISRGTSAEDPRPAREIFPESRVKIGILIDAEGRPLFPQVIETPDARLGPAALDAAMRIRFVPPRSQGDPVAVRATIPLKFPASEDRAFPLQQVTNLPEPRHQVSPAYPFEAMQSRVDGSVTLRFVVTKVGKVTDITVVVSTHSAFEQPAINALSQWVFEPARVDGRPVNALIQLPMHFNLPRPTDLRLPTSDIRHRPSTSDADTDL